MRIVLCDSGLEKNHGYINIMKKYAASQETDCGLVLLTSGEQMLLELSDDPDDTDLIISDTDFADKMGGIDVVCRLREIGYTGEVIFFTAEKEKVFDSFRARPFDYLLKSEVEYEEFMKITDDALKTAMKRKRDTITFSCAGEIKNIALEDILYFESVQRIIEVHYGGDVFEFYSTMGKLENLIMDKGFVRTHRKFLVNTKHISYRNGNELVLDNGEMVPLHPANAKKLNLEIQDE